MKKQFLYLLLLVFVLPVFAQKNEILIVDGKCFMKIIEPPIFKTVTEQVLISEHGCGYFRPPKTIQKYDTIRKKGFVGIQNGLKIDIPVYKTITKIVETSAQDREEKPLKYETVTKKVMVKRAEIAWVETLCEEKIDATFRLKLADALLAKGYDAGLSENNFPYMQQALTKFQENSANLPCIGSLDGETLRALSIETP